MKMWAVYSDASLFILNTTKIYPLTKNIIHTHIHAILAKDVYICTKIESQGQS